MTIWGISTANFMPHGHCVLWDPKVLLPMVISEVLIFIAYAAIPFGIYYFMRRRIDLDRHARLTLWLFVAFILFCGFTHLIGAWNYWHTNYILELTLKAVTAAVSLITAVVVARYIPQLLKLPSPESYKSVIQELEQANLSLESTIVKRSRDLADETNQLTSVLAGVADGILEYDPMFGTNSEKSVTDFSVRVMNNQACQQLQSSRNEIEGKSLRCGLDQQLDSEHFQACLEVLATGKPHVEDPQYHSILRRSFRTVITRRQSADRLLVFFSDVTEREQTKLEAMVQSKFAALGELAGGISHEIKTPLQILGGKLRKIKRTMPSTDQETTQALETMEKTLASINHIVQNMNRLVREDSNNMKRINLKQLLKAISQSFGMRVANSGVQLVEKYQDKPEMWVIGHQISIVQIVSNLFSNALYEANRKEDGQICIDLINRDGNAIIEIADNGEGIATALEGKIFQPLFTTKDVGVGSGLGLSLSRRMAQDMGGELTLLQDGLTRFQLILTGDQL